MPSLNYDSCGILTRTDIRSVRYVEEGYTTDGLDALCSRIGPLTEEATSDGTGYLNIPPALHMWNADEPYYTQIAGVELYPELSQSQFNDNPYTGNTFVDLWRAFDGSSGTLDDWDAEEYQEPDTCQAVVEYTPGFMRSPIPSIQFIVDTASVSINKVITSINTSITTVITSDIFIDAVTEIVQSMGVGVSITSKTSCITVTSSPVSGGGSAFELEWVKDIEDFIELDNDVGLTFVAADDNSADCPTKLKLQFTQSECHPGTIAFITDTGKIDARTLCPPEGEGLWALTWDGTGYTWMEIASCEEAEA